MGFVKSAQAIAIIPKHINIFSEFERDYYNYEKLGHRVSEFVNGDFRTI